MIANEIHHPVCLSILSFIAVQTGCTASSSLTNHFFLVLFLSLLTNDRPRISITIDPCTTAPINSPSAHCSGLARNQGSGQRSTKCRFASKPLFSSCKHSSVIFSLYTDTLRGRSWRLRLSLQPDCLPFAIGRLLKVIQSTSNMENDKWRNNRTCPVRVVLRGVLVCRLQSSFCTAGSRSSHGAVAAKWTDVGQNRFFVMCVIDEKRFC